MFLALFGACSMLTDVRMKMWNDEIITLYVAQQGSPGEIVAATKDGMDATPPLYPILVSTILPGARPDALAVRLPSTLGFAGMLACVLLFCRRRMPGSYALIGGLLVAITAGFYATEGRCYGLMLGFAAGALVCWQAATEHCPRATWLVLLSLCLMLATALHYYAIFLLVPLGLAELVRWRERRQLDFPIVVAMLPALAALAVHYPLIAAGRRYLAHFWTPGIASWRQIPEFYLEFALLPAGVLLVGFLAFSLTARSNAAPDSRERLLPAHEWVAVGGFALLPILVVVVSKFTTQVFLSRYALCAVIGIAIATAALLCRMTAQRPIIATALVAILFVSFVAYEIFRLRQPTGLRQGEAVERELESLPDGPEPIVIAYDHAFMELSYYAEPRLRGRLYYLLSQKLELQHRGSDLDYLLLSAVGKRTKLHIVGLDDFLRTTPRFLLAARDEDYLPEEMTQAGYCLAPAASPGVYQVEARRSNEAGCVER